MHAYFNKYECAPEKTGLMTVHKVETRWLKFLRAQKNIKLRRIQFPPTALFVSFDIFFASMRLPKKSL